MRFCTAGVTFKSKSDVLNHRNSCRDAQKVNFMNSKLDIDCYIITSSNDQFWLR